jgi:hypothetical protein
MSPRSTRWCHRTRWRRLAHWRFCQIDLSTGAERSARLAIGVTAQSVHGDDMHITPTREHIMKRHGAKMGAFAFAALVLVPAATASANGGNGASYCSNQGPPAGDFAGDIYDDSTYGNAGEIVSWFSQQGLKPIGPWGQTVKVACDPTAP